MSHSKPFIEKKNTTILAKLATTGNPLKIKDMHNHKFV